MNFTRVTAFLLVAIAVIFGGVTFYLRQTPGVIFEDAVLIIAQNGNVTTYSGRQDGEKILITCSQDDTSAHIIFSIGSIINYQCRVSFLGEEIIAENGKQFDLVEVTCNGSSIFRGGYDPNAIYEKFCTENGTIIKVEKDRTITSFGRWHEYKLSINDILEFGCAPQQIVRGSWLAYVLGLIASIVCYLYIRHAIIVNQAIHSFAEQKHLKAQAEEQRQKELQTENMWKRLGHSLESETSFESAFMEWLRLYKSPPTRKPSTYASYLDTYNTHFALSFGNMPLYQITQDVIQEYYQKKQLNGARMDGKKGGLSPKTIRNHHMILKDFFTYAQSKYKLDGNPTLSTTRPEVVAKEMRVLSPSEMQIF